MSYVQSATGTSTGTAITATLPAPPTPGHMLVAAHATRAGTLVVPAGWEVAVTRGLGNMTMIVLYRLAQEGDLAALTVNLATGTGGQTLWVGQYNGPTALDSAKAVQHNAGSGTTSITPGRLPVTRATDTLVIGAWCSIGAGTATPDGVATRDTVTTPSQTTLVVGDAEAAGHVEPRAAFTSPSEVRAIAALVAFSMSPQIDVGVAHAHPGALTQTGFTVGAKVSGAGPVRVAVSTQADMSNPAWFGPANPDSFGHAKIPVTGLTPGTEYHWRIENNGQQDPTKPGRLRTLPTSGSIRIGHASCAAYRQNGLTTVQTPVSTHVVFDSLRDADLDLFMHSGDFHYMDIEDDDESQYRAALDHVLASPKQAACWRNTPTIYMWDDHDFGANDSNRHNPGVGANRASYRGVWPHYPLPFTGPIHQRVDVTDKVRYLVLDGRSESDSRTAGQSPAKTKIGTDGRAWLKTQITQARADGIWLLLIEVGTPWIADDGFGDTWGAYIHERQEIADHIHAEGMQNNVCMTAGDMHGIAADNGTNAVGGWPVFQAAALDRSGSLKGGPYSEGYHLNVTELGAAADGQGQFGLLDITDNGTSLDVAWQGITVERWGDQSSPISYTFSVTQPPPPDEEPPPGDPSTRRDAAKRLILALAGR